VDEKIYHLLDVDLTLAAPLTVLEEFDGIYGAFLDSCGCEICRRRRPLAVTVRVSPSPGNTWRVSSPWGEVSRPADDLLTYLFFLLQNHVVRSSRAFLALHGASLEIGGAGCIVTAASSVGKTTLALELLRRGAGFLSDEIAAIPLARPLQHAFPRALGLRPGSLEALRLSEGEAGRKVHLAGEIKYVLDPETLSPGSRRPTVPLGSIFVLTPPPEGGGEEREGVEYLEISLGALSPSFSEGLEKLPAVHSVELLEGRPYETLRIAYEPGSLIVEKVDALALETGTVVSGHHRGRTAPVDYGAPPRARALSLPEGLGRLMANVLNAREITAGSVPAKFAFRMAHLLRGVRLHELHPGRLEETADLVESLHREAPSPTP